ncbi:MAG: adenylate/guanylate cyclase domain-containing protein, partial [Deltaproteobacteria bacterium]|nr:adenylate/guanylate cyclase domain-containing protein [Deltaproteobacteria bacterium]
MSGPMLSSLARLINGASWTRFRVVFAASLALSLAGVVLSLPGTNIPFEGSIYDFWSGGTHPRLNPAAPVPKVVVLAIDDQSLNNPRRSQPEIFSPSVWAEILEALVACGVKAVAIHRALPAAESRSYPRSEEGAWFQAVQTARRLEIPVIYGFRHRVDQPILPSVKYLEVMGRESLGFLDLVHDRDDKVRRLPIVWPEGDELIEGRPSLSFAFLAAAAVNPAVSAPSDPFYIDFSRVFTKLSFADLHERALAGEMEVLRRFLDDAVVVIGETSSLNMDAWPTPISVYGLDGRGWSLTPAVEIQAHAIDTLLSGSVLSHPGPLVVWLFFLGLAFLALTPVLLSAPRSGGHPCPWMPPLVLAFYPVIAYLAFLRQVFLPVVPGVAILALANLAYLGLRIRETSMMQRAGSQALKVYLNPLLAGQIINDPEVLKRRGEVRNATVLFADLVGFTSLAESMDTASVVDMLNRYFETMNTAIERFDGYVDKFMGDGIMAVWGAPMSQPLHAVSACLSALMQNSLMERLNLELAASGKPTLEALLGLSTGDV